MSLQYRFMNLILPLLEQSSGVDSQAPVGSYQSAN
jgi:hypothetical protein